jgi:hypothetical protein
MTILSSLQFLRPNSHRNVKIAAEITDMNMVVLLDRLPGKKNSPLGAREKNSSTCNINPRSHIFPIRLEHS